MTLPDCPTCGAAAHYLRPHGAYALGHQWYVCAKCHRSVLLTDAGEVARVGKP